MSKELTEEIIEQLENYLAGRSTGQETAAWAVGVLTRRTFNASEKLMEDALTALAGLHDGDERFDTAREDLIYFKNCLLARVPYTVSRISRQSDSRRAEHLRDRAKGTQ